MYIDLFSDNKKHSKYDKYIVEEINKVKCEIKNALSQFNYATDSKEIESTIYRLKSLETRYSLLIRNAKLNKNINIKTAGVEKI